jgi:single-strand DNA-binding protein
MDRRYPLLNKVMFIGRLVRDCEVKFLETGTQITQFSIALDGAAHRGMDAAFINFSNIGDFNVAEYLKKGTQVFVEGHIDQTRKEVDGQKRTFTNFLCDRLQLLSAARSSDELNSVVQKENDEAFNALDMPSIDESFFYEPMIDAKEGSVNHGKNVFQLLEEHYGESSEWTKNRLTLLTGLVKSATGKSPKSVSVAGLKGQLASIPAYDAQKLVTQLYKRQTIKNSTAKEKNHAG